MNPDLHGARKRKLPDLKHARITDIVIGVFYQVYGELGFGFLESVYLNAMEKSLVAAGLSVQREALLLGEKPKFHVRELSPILRVLRGSCFRGAFTLTTSTAEMG